MVGVLLLFLGVFPLVLYYFTTVKLDLEHDIVSYYIIEGIIVFILITIANIYFYKKYALNFLPATEQIISGSIGFLFIAVLFYIGAFVRSLFTSKERPEVTMIMMIFIFAMIILVLFIPLMEKYEYSQRISNMNEMLKLNDTKYIKEIDGLKIFLVDSSRQNHVRTRYNTSPNYRNYFYVKNTNDTTYNGKVILSIYGKDHNYIGSEIMKSLEIAPGDIQLLTVDKEIHYNYDVWNEKSFVSQEKIYYFNALLTSD